MTTTTAAPVDPAEVATRPTRRWPELVVRTLLVGLVLTALVPFGSLFASSRYLLVAAGAAVLTTIISAVLSPRSAAVAAIGLVGLGVFELWVVLGVGVPSPGALGDGWRLLTGSWRALLSVPLPAPAEPALLALPALLAGVAALASAELAARTRLAVAPTVPALLVFVVTLLFTAAQSLQVVVAVVLALPPPASAPTHWCSAHSSAHARRGPLTDL
jgi:hypothetical protein